MRCERWWQKRGEVKYVAFVVCTKSCMNICMYVCMYLGTLFNTGYYLICLMFQFNFIMCHSHLVLSCCFKSMWRHKIFIEHSHIRCYLTHPKKIDHVSTPLLACNVNSKLC
jgi:hypothetical protein